MINNEMAEKMAKLAEQGEFVAKAEQAENTEELAKLLNEYGLDITAEDLNDAATNAYADGELSAEEMDAVSGGRFMSGGDMVRWIINIFISPFTNRSSKPSTTTVPW